MQGAAVKVWAKMAWIGTNPGGVDSIWTVECVVLPDSKKNTAGRLPSKGIPPWCFEQSKTFEHKTARRGHVRSSNKQ